MADDDGTDDPCLSCRKKPQPAQNNRLRKKQSSNEAPQITKHRSTKGLAKLRRGFMTQTHPQILRTRVKNRRGFGHSLIRTARPGACASWDGSATGSGMVRAWSGDTGETTMPRPFPLCSQFCSQFPAPSFNVFRAFSVSATRTINTASCIPFLHKGTLGTSGTR
jgi:hypothetical protein